jgi:lysozyme
MPDPQPAAVQLATEFEGFSASPYWDPADVPTIGYGSIWVNGYPPGADESIPERVTMDTPPIDEPTARVWLAHELKEAACVVMDDVDVPLTPGEEAALEDFVYNLGAGNFASSTLLRKLNRGDYAGAADQLELWDHAGGKVLSGLLRRRQAEKKLFFGG